MKLVVPISTILLVAGTWCAMDLGACLLGYKETGRAMASIVDTAFFATVIIFTAALNRRLS